MADELLRPPKRARGRWRADETAALIKAWKPIYERRRDGKVDKWVPARWHYTARCGNLVAADWRVVAAAVNASRDAMGLGSHRDPRQCKDRIGTIAKHNLMEHFITTLRDEPIGRPPPVPVEPELVPQDQDDVVTTAGGAVEKGSGGDAEEQAAQQEEDVPDGVVEEESGGDDAEDASTVVEPAAQQEDMDIPDGDAAAGGSVAGDGDGLGDAAGCVRRSAAAADIAVHGLHMHIPKRARSAGPAASGAAGMRLRGGASPEGSGDAAVADLFGVAPMTGAASVSSSVAEVVIKVTEMCKNVTAMCENVILKSLEVEREAARGSGAGNHP